VLLQPELLDSYASSMVNAAKTEPEGLGSIIEDDALAGRFFVPEEQKIKDKGEEQLLLYSTLEELVRHDLALRETTEDGRYLVFPSQFIRDYEDSPEPKGKSLVVTFEGPVQSIYATLAVRLSHCGFFKIDRSEMWRNAAIFSAYSGGKCGIYLKEFAEARGELTLFFNSESRDETRFYFEEYILAHLERRSLEGTINVTRLLNCPKCFNPVPNAYIKILSEQGHKIFDCPCGGKVSLTDSKESPTERYPSKIEAMDRSADLQRDFEVFEVSARGETHTNSFVEWAGGKDRILAIVFTDIKTSMALDERFMSNIRNAHFDQGRRLLKDFDGREIKAIGDSLMMAFHSVENALDFTMAFHENTGHNEIRICAGIHVGPLQVQGSDTFGNIVNFAAHMLKEIKLAEIWLSGNAKQEIDRLGSPRYQKLRWKRNEGIAMGRFHDKFTFWALDIKKDDELLKFNKKSNNNAKGTYLLHLSDIHLENAAQANIYRTQLETDLIKELKVLYLDYLIISGDIANNSSKEEYAAAYSMIDGLIQRFHLSASHVIIVPGNHDVNWDQSEMAYKFVPRRKLPDPLQDGKYIPAGEAGVLLCNEKMYEKRFANFNNEFYKKIHSGQDYPLDYAQQAIITEFADDRILFLALNSCWQIDHYFRNRAGISIEALSHALDKLQDGSYDEWLKIAVWHHPITGVEMMKDEFMQLLAIHGFHICMHGHIHEAIEGYHKYDNKYGINIIGAGAFGAPLRTEMPFQYNLIKVDKDLGEIIVNTRKKEKFDGAWSADSRWGEKGTNPKPFYSFKPKYYKPSIINYNR